MAASLTLRGVSKSGSPCDRLMTFLPSAIIRRATVEMAMVRLGWIRSSRSAVSDMVESRKIGGGPYRSGPIAATGRENRAGVPYPTAAQDAPTLEGRYMAAAGSG